jgi:hypothetical protein
MKLKKEIVKPGPQEADSSLLPQVSSTTPSANSLFDKINFLKPPQEMQPCHMGMDPGV